MAGATENFILDKGYDADGAIDKGAAVKFSAIETVTQCDGEGDNVIGIAVFEVTTDDIARGKGASVRREGAALVVAADDEAFDSGDLVAIGATGWAVAANAGARVIGTCDEGWDGSGDGSGFVYIRVALDLPGSIGA